MRYETASTPISGTITKAITFLCELSVRKDISIISISADHSALKVSFILHNPDTNEDLQGERTFNENTQFRDAEDLLDELWMTKDLFYLSVT